MPRAAVQQEDGSSGEGGPQRSGMKSWTLHDIPWDRFDPEQVDSNLISVVKTASLVERNSADYAAYLCNVFHDDPQFREATLEWAREERQHGEALGRWAEMADPAFDFEDSFQKFAAGYKISLGTDGSIRGSRSGELIARCVIESGTSSYYSALRDGSNEPVLKAICHRIAGDEFRHYKLFYKYLQVYLPQEQLPMIRKLHVVFSRFSEIDDDELAFAYHCANHDGMSYNRSTASVAYAHRSSIYYRRDHVERAVGMMIKAAGLSPGGWISKSAAFMAWMHVRRQQIRSVSV